ncbi:MAG: hypothetical protein D6687_06110 [Acidobacteria bacterium]|nr:MAG: hypothetical protein D6687_06110 [Acidobacteriota bacterium]
MRKLAIVLILFISSFNYAQMSEENYKIFDSTGNPQTLDKVIEKIQSVDVVFLGEQHDDAVAHYLQEKIFRLAFEKYGSQRQLVLSMEMFERDVQVILDEYLIGLITEGRFLSDARPWGNYKTDYRPLVEFAKTNKIPVIASNAPRRYVNMVSRQGRDVLTKLSEQAKKWIAPLPYQPPSQAYAEKFLSLMGKSHPSENESVKAGMKRMLDAQTLWDATMAFSIAEVLKQAKTSKQEKKPLVIHLNGSFHSENGLGIPEHLTKYFSDAKYLVVTFRKEEDFNNFDKEKHENLGDFVILTNSKASRKE